MKKSPFGSILLTIVIASIAVVLSITLLVGWTLLTLQNETLQEALADKVGDNTWILVGGIVSFSLIIVVLVAACVVLVREIVEGRRQTTFIDSVTHELKSPLASLKLGLETYGRPGVSPGQLESFRLMMLDDVDRLAVFIDDILVASQVAAGPFAGRRGYNAEHIDLRALVERCACLIERRHGLTQGCINARYIDATKKDVEHNVELVSDEVALEIILKNLLDNAVKYSLTAEQHSEPEDHSDSVMPAVRVVVQELEDKRGRLQISVYDEGIGMGTQHLQRIFARFYRVPSEAVRQRRGTGLGLYVVSRLVRRLGGRLRAFSRGEGEGTCMRVVLPTGGARSTEQANRRIDGAV